MCISMLPPPGRLVYTSIHTTRRILHRIFPARLSRSLLIPAVIPTATLSPPPTTLLDRLVLFAPWSEFQDGGGRGARDEGSDACGHEAPGKKNNQPTNQPTELTDERIDGSTQIRRNERTNERLNERMNERLNEQMSERINKAERQKKNGTEPSKTANKRSQNERGNGAATSPLARSHTFTRSLAGILLLRRLLPHL